MTGSSSATTIPGRPAVTVASMAGVRSSWAGQRAWFRLHPLAGDSLLAALLLAAQLVVLAAVGQEEVRPEPWLSTSAWGLAEVSAVALRRRLPLIAVAICAGYSAAAIAFQPAASTGGGFAILIVGYTVGAYLPLRRALFMTAVLWAPALVAGSLWPPAGRATVPVWYLLAFNLLFAAIAFFIGRTVYNRRAYTAALEERARTAEQNQRSLAEQAVAEERRRIARELHDVVAHHVSVMGVLATGARRVLPRDPGAADEVLGTIEETGRTVLREMRRLLTVLRTEAEPAAELAPQPGLGGIETLVEQLRDAGLPVRLVVAGDPVPLDPGVALTLFRIVQEALTNTLKHAGAATAEVRLDFGRLWLHLEIFDTGHGPRLPGSHIGHGLLGMRERVALYGGTLRTGPRPGGGFRVYAKIPMDQLEEVRG
jgi:signal transduction histidine kinase